MYCQHGTITNTNGDSLPGYFVECVNAAGVIQTIYSDANSTAIVTVSGVANRAKADARGNYTYFVTGGVYDEKYYNAAGVYQLTVTSLPMIDLLAAQAPSVQSVVSAATVTPTFGDDQVVISAQAAALILANPTGTALPGWGIAIRIKDNGTARAITYGTQYRAMGITLPTTTVASKTLYLGIIYNATDAKFDVVAVAQEAEPMFPINILLSGKNGIYSIAPTLFTDNALTIDQTDYKQTSPLARSVFVTTATSVVVNGYCTIFANYPAFSELGVYVDGVFLQSVVATANGAFSATLTLSAGSKTISIVNGAQTKISGAILGTYLVSVSCNATVAQSFPAVTARALFLADSIGTGVNASPPTNYSYISRLRKVTTDSMTVYGWGFNTFMSIAGDATLRTALMSVITPLAPTRIVDTLGTNDYALLTATPANFAIAKAALYDAIHTALPSATIFAVKPIVRSDEGVANGIGSTIADYRAAFDTAATGRAWVTVVNGFAFMTAADLADGVHPTTHGHLLWAQGIAGSLGYTVPNDPVGTNPMNAGPDALGTLTTVSAGVYTIEKTSGTTAFDCGFYSAPRTGDFRYQLDLIVDCDFMVGVNASAGTQSGYTDMSYQIYPTAGGALNKYNGSTAQGSATPGTRGSGTAGRLWVDRTGTTYTISMGVTYAGASVLRTDTLSGTYAIDFSVAQVGGKMTVTVVV